MEFLAGFAAGSGLLLALVSAVYVLFPSLWPMPMRMGAIGPAAVAAAPQAVPPGEALLKPAAPRTDAHPMTTADAGSPQAAPPTGIVKTVITKVDAPKPVAVATTTTAPGAVAPARIAAAVEPPPVAEVSLKGAYGIYLSSFPDRDLAGSGWQILVKRYAKGLQGLKPQIVEARRGGQKVYRLFAGPLKSQGDAEDRCRLLAYGSLNCKPADFTGGVEPAQTLAWEG